MSGTMRQIHSKNVGYKIEHMKWSNRMDLLVISNDKGEVIVHRLNLQKIWTHPPPQEGVRIRGLDWRPDEKIIAVGYSSGMVALLDIEHQMEIYVFHVNSDICCLSWTQNHQDIQDDSESDNLLDRHETYLPPLPCFNSLSSNAPKFDYNSTHMYSKKVLNMLVVGLHSGVVHLSVFGVLPCGRIDIAKHLQLPSARDMQIVDAKMSSDFRQLQVLVRMKVKRLHLITIKNEMLPRHLWPLLQLANKHSHILNTLGYVEDIIQCITEAWETALLEMDNKLTKYANAHPNGSVSADFLELLIFGFPSEDLEDFLTRDLTEKGLKKLGSSIEISYSTIQKLVVKPLHTGILNICYHLNTIKGMSRNAYYYKALLGSPSNKPFQNAGALLIKSLELEQTIEQSTRDFKIFWCWLYGVVIRLMDEVIPDEVAAVSQQDIIHLAEFLNNFDAHPDDVSDDPSAMETTSGAPTPQHKKRFNLERVGQYLQDQPLQLVQTADLTQKWDQLLEENECLKECELIYSNERHLSLVQQHNQLKRSIDELFESPEQLIGKNYARESSCQVAFGIDTAYLRSTHVNHTADGCSLFATLVTLRQLVLTEVRGTFERAITVQILDRPYFDHKFGAAFGKLEFRDIDFYNEHTLSVLLFNRMETPDMANCTNCFVQFPVAAARERMVNTASDGSHQSAQVNFYEMLDASLVRHLEGADAARISVSGSRKVAALLSESQKRLRVFEMEVDEEDDDLLDMSQSSVGLDASRESAQSS